MKLKELTDIQRKVLSDLIQMKAPNTHWLTPQAKEDTYKVWDSHRDRLLDSDDDWYLRKTLSGIFSIVGMDDAYQSWLHPKWKTITGGVDVSKFAIWWNNGQIISTRIYIWLRRRNKNLPKLVNPLYV